MLGNLLLLKKTCKFHGREPLLSEVELRPQNFPWITEENQYKPKRR